MSHYDDILFHTYPFPSQHTKMSQQDRAAQFSPFAALTNYGAAIEETGRLTDNRIQIEEYSQNLLDQKQQLLFAYKQLHPLIVVTFFVPDHKKDGGCYQQITGHFKNIDVYNRMLLLQDGTQIALADILDLESDLFQHPDFSF